MARVLESLKPLVALLGQASDPADAAHGLAATATAGGSGASLAAQLGAAVIDAQLAGPALTHAGVLDDSGALTPNGPMRLAQVAVLCEAAGDGGWELVLTVPGFLRAALDGLIVEHGDGAKPRETSSVLREVAGSARRRLLIAAPYLHGDFVRLLVPDVERVLAGGGDAVVITRALSLTSRSRSSANVAAVALLRRVAERSAGRLTVHSWEESGLGVHFKVVLADMDVAYLGSANLTLGGTVGHAEAGVLLRGSGVDGLARWLDAVCGELARRRLPHG